MNGHTQVASTIDPIAYPKIDLNETSKRRGAEGTPRYVQSGRCLGDTNTGRCVFPVGPPPVYSDSIDRALARVQAFQNGRAVQFGGADK